MQCLSRKQVLASVITLVVLVAIVASLPPVRVQYHKWRLESMKARKARLLAANPSVVDRFWLNLGYPVSGQELDAGVRKHEAALVRLGFLKQTELPSNMVATCPQTLETLNELQSECPWYHGETVSNASFVVTACPKMMEHWRKRAKELGWEL